MHSISRESSRSIQLFIVLVADADWFRHEGLHLYCRGMSYVIALFWIIPPEIKTQEVRIDDASASATRRIHYPEIQTRRMIVISPFTLSGLLSAPSPPRSLLATVADYERRYSSALRICAKKGAEVSKVQEVQNCEVQRFRHQRLREVGPGEGEGDRCTDSAAEIRSLASLAACPRAAAISYQVRASSFAHVR